MFGFLESSAKNTYDCKRKIPKCRKKKFKKNMTKSQKFDALKSENGHKTQKKRKFKILKKIVMQNVIRKVCTNFHDPRAFGCRDMTAERQASEDNKNNNKNNPKRHS